MAKVVFVDQNLEIEVPSVARSSKPHRRRCPRRQRLWRRLRLLDLPRLRGERRRALERAEEDEEDILDKAFDVRMNSRLGCQSKLQREGIVRVRISKESLEAYFHEHPAPLEAQK
jgi:hypothetical protein